MIVPASIHFPRKAGSLSIISCWSSSSMVGVRKVQGTAYIIQEIQNAQVKKIPCFEEKCEGKLGMIIALPILKIVGIIVFAIVLMLVITSGVSHRVRMHKEAGKYPPLGTMVSVGGGAIHIYTAGEGKTSLIFLAGHATSCPTLDFKPLWSRLSDAYKIIVVERAGYGWSDGSASSRDVDTVLGQTRKALKLAGYASPYVLVPHSMGFLEALRWTQTYPDEVQAIIGLDPCVPAAVNILPRLQKIQLDAIHSIARIGLTRFMPESVKRQNLPLLDSDALSDTDKDQYLAMFHRSAVTANMVKEYKYLKLNAEIVEKFGVPDKVPMLFFLSEEQERTAPGWIAASVDYLCSVSQGTYRLLATSHYVHHQKSEVIASEAGLFLAHILQ